jgi:hypothetical protein
MSQMVILISFQFPTIKTKKKLNTLKIRKKNEKGEFFYSLQACWVWWEKLWQQLRKAQKEEQKTLILWGVWCWNGCSWSCWLIRRSLIGNGGCWRWRKERTPKLEFWRWWTLETFMFFLVSNKRWSWCGCVLLRECLCVIIVLCFHVIGKTFFF